ncbi:MAG TPA: rhodanese-like domain-containing protein [Pyrinomonadaceae bacterium]|nr:rhodanese-like domain-containing protein [Pyrinomonadaceae bacterium]
MSRKNVFVFICVFVASCSSGKQLAVEQAPIPKSTTESTPVKLPVAQVARLAEVEDAVKRVFKDAAVLDLTSKPNFVSGDFNGDASQDLAVVLKPAPGKIEAMNEAYAPWLLRDPRSNQNERRPQLHIDQDERILAVIHGNGVNDWRDPEATQTFVLKNVVGSDLRMQNGKDFAAANTGRKLPRPQGDLIVETLQGTPGYLYYAISTYSWYDPKTFKGESQAPGVFHKSRPMHAHANVRGGSADGCGGTARHSLAAHPSAEPSPMAAQLSPVIGMISAVELKVKLNNNESVTIIDVRGSEGYAASRTTIKGAWHFKLRRLKSRFKFSPLKDLPKDREIVTYCACPKDESSISAAQIFQEAGFKRVKVLQGGWSEWVRNNGPVQPK